MTITREALLQWAEEADEGEDVCLDGEALRIIAGMVAPDEVTVDMVSAADPDVGPGMRAYIAEIANRILRGG